MGGAASYGTQFWIDPTNSPRRPSHDTDGDHWHQPDRQSHQGSVLCGRLKVRYPTSRDRSAPVWVASRNTHGLADSADNKEMESPEMAVI